MGLCRQNKNKKKKNEPPHRITLDRAQHELKSVEEKKKKKKKDNNNEQPNSKRRSVKDLRER